MTWPLLLGLMLVAAGVAWYSVARFIPQLRAMSARPAAITIASALSVFAVGALASVPITGDAVWLLAGLAPWLVIAATPDTLVRLSGGQRPWQTTRPPVQPGISAVGSDDASSTQRIAAPIAAAMIVLGAALRAGAPVCADAELAASEGPDRASTQSGALSDLLLEEPGSDFTLVLDAPMDLEIAAASRVDTLTLQQLRKAQFVEGHDRLWIRDDGTMLGNDVFRFATSEGADEYHRAVTAYACSYSSGTFEVPGGGVGLRIRYNSGDPIRDQVAWTDGNHRMVVAIGYQEAPGDHAEILGLVQRLRMTTDAP